MMIMVMMMMMKMMTMMTTMMMMMMMIMMMLMMMATAVQFSGKLVGQPGRRLPSLPGTTCELIIIIIIIIIIIVIIIIIIIMVIMINITIIIMDIMMNMIVKMIMRFISFIDVILYHMYFSDDIFFTETSNCITEMMSTTTYIHINFFHLNSSPVNL